MLSWCTRLLSAVDTLAPQSFGAGNMPEVGFLVQRGIISVFATFIITSIIWYNAESMLLAFNQPAAESHLAAVFLRYHIFSVPALVLWESARRFMWSQNVTQWPFVIITAGALAIHLICLHGLIQLIGFVGAPLSHVITTWSMVLGVCLWIKIKRPHHPETWHVNNKIVMNRKSMKIFLRIALPGILSMSEGVFFEFFIFLSGTLGPENWQQTDKKCLSFTILNPKVEIIIEEIGNTAPKYRVRRAHSPAPRSTGG